METDEEKNCPDCCGVMVYHSTIGRYHLFQCLACKALVKECANKPKTKVDHTPCFLDEWG